MSGIRALQRDDLPSVCRLYERVVRYGLSDDPLALVDYFTRTTMDQPWADDDIPSLVHTDADGCIVGFLASHVRRMRLDGRPIRLACSGQLVAAPEPQHRGVGALLMRRYLAGPQDITTTDGATDYVRRVWSGLGGRTHTVASVGWAKFLRPAGVAGVLAERGGRRRLTQALARVGGLLDAAGRRAMRGSPGFLPAPPRTTAEPLTIEGLLEQIRHADRQLRLRPDYDLRYLHWLFAELDAVGFRGESVRHLVRDERGRVVGWYVYYLAPGGIAQVLQVAAPQGNHGDVLDHLLWHADAGGAAAVLGRVEPGLLAELHARRCVLVPTDWCLVHSRDPAVLALLDSPQTLLSRLDGEWWMGHHSLGLSARALSARRAAAAVASP